ncbi:cbb3-type cytochrome oxidase assembly protein CcoS [Pseudomonas oryzae]|uniref:Cytochrome oxidase maturation protein, cbb3-type n=1 Tax=Pseudomonas oryzae TaxID=1392877 RepID=A0A1H1M8Z9_9PSED|nr:cbb3-type cytochrome oxidase assembly protein CcoS [Pseudomonas oryzae]SDR83216.1 cytochrome oxidase maturation protein, cbb3-type [Pseudomonas oryzae]
MSALYLLIPVAVVLVALAIWMFFWAVDNGQYDDLDSPAHSILFDDEDPNHQAGIDEASAKSATDSDHPTDRKPPRG